MTKTLIKTRADRPKKLKNEIMKEHELKTWPVFYEKIIDGSKPFEVRNNDRKFQVGDILLLREYDPDAEAYTGRSCKRKVTYILGDNPFFQLNNTVIMGISHPDQGVTEDEINNVISRHDCHLEFYQQVYLVEELHGLFQSRNTVDLRSEHVKLITWVFDNWDNSMTDGNNEAVVDKYLSTRK